MKPVLTCIITVYIGISDIPIVASNDDLCYLTPFLIVCIFLY